MKHHSPFLLLLLSLFLLINCQSNQDSYPLEGSSKDVNAIASVPETDKYQQLREMSNDSLWHYLLFQKGGCLTGGQYVYDDHFGSEGCVMSRTKEWEIFFGRDEKQLSAFLLNQLTADTTHTRIHTCPFSNATTGEVAVYSLQKIHLINWYDFEAFSDYKDKAIESSKDNPQAWLQDVLNNTLDRKKLIALWVQENLRL